MVIRVRMSIVQTDMRFFFYKTLLITLVLIGSPISASDITDCDKVATGWNEIKKVTKPVFFHTKNAPELFEICKKDLLNLGIDLLDTDEDLIKKLTNNTKSLRLMNYLIYLDLYAKKTNKDFVTWQNILFEAGADYAAHSLAMLNLRKKNYVEAKRYAEIAIERGNFLSYEVLWTIETTNDQGQRIATEASRGLAKLFQDKALESNDFRFIVMAKNTLASDHAISKDYENAYQIASEAILALDNPDLSCGKLYAKDGNTYKNDFYCVDDILQPAHTLFSLRAVTVDMLNNIQNKSLVWWLINRATDIQSRQSWFYESHLLNTFALDFLDQIEADSNFILPNEGSDWYRVRYSYTTCMSSFNLNLNVEGIKLASDALQIIKSKKLENNQFEPYLYNCLALNQDQLGSNEEALINYKIFYDFLKNTEHSLYWAHTNLGLKYLDNNDLDNAEFHLNEAFLISEDRGNENFSEMNLGNSLSDLAYLYYKKDQFLKSEEFHKKSFEILKESKDPNQEGFLIFNYQKTLIALEKYQEAISLGEKFISKIEDKNKSLIRISTFQDGFYNLNNISQVQLAKIYANIAFAKNSLFGKTNGFADSLKAISFIERFRENNGDYIYREFEENNQIREIYSIHFDICTNFNSAEEEMQQCFASYQGYSKSLKNQRLKELASNIVESKKSTLFNDLLDFYKKKDRIFKFLTLAEDKRLGTNDYLIDELQEIESRIDEISFIIKSNDNKLYDYFDNIPLELNAIKNSLSDDELFLGYFVTKNKLFSFEILNKNSKINSMPIGETEILELVTKIRYSLDNVPIFRNDLADFDVKAAYDLYTKIFYPVISNYKKKQIKKVVLLKDLYLKNIPFNILISKEPKANNYKNINWLAKDYLFTSIKEIQDFRSNKDLFFPENKYIGFGNPIFSSQLISLPETEEEINSVAELFDSNSDKNIYLKDRASEINFKKLDGVTTNILHFATHNILNTSFNEPALALSIDPNSMDDGLLTSSEIAAQSVKSNLVLLSACSTALSNQSGRQDVFDLSRAFQFSGSSAVLVSHWDISSNVTSELIINMLKSKKAETSYAESMQISILGLLSNPETSHPFYWGAFELVES